MQVKDMWRESGGFEAIVTAVSSLDGSFRGHHGGSDGGTPLAPESLGTGEGGPEQGQGSGGADLRGIAGGADAAGEGAGSGAGVGSKEKEEVLLVELEHFQVIRAAILTLVTGMAAGPAAVVRGERLLGFEPNRRYLREVIGYDTVRCCIVSSGVVGR
ncbi:unnamed protein product [Discosporangium mesarthrocarpum]